MNPKSRRITAFLITAGLLLAILWGGMFTIIEAKHECSGEDCPVCSCIAAVGEIFRQLSLLHGTPGNFSHALILFTLLTIQLIPCSSLRTLITLKVKLSD